MVINLKKEGHTMAEYGKNNRRVPTRVHTRELDRGVARTNMKKAGLHQVAKGKFFSDNWRKYAEVDPTKKNRRAVKLESNTENAENTESTENKE